MTPAELDRYTAETREGLKDASAHRVEGASGVLSPYEAGPPPTATGPFTFASAFMWSPEANAQKQTWAHLITGMKLAAGEIYPECPMAWAEFNIAKAEYVSLVLAQYYAKSRRTIRGNLVFIEADVVCNKRCDPFEADFDIGLPDAKDKWAMMPFNPGVMFVKDTPGAQRFLDTVMEYATHVPGIGPYPFPTWYAYQLALGHTYMALKDEVNVKVFPHVEYNWSPDIYAPTDAYFVHLKGNRKQFQRDYIVPLIEGRRGRLLLPCT
jgi:hypothetical protein